MTERKTLGCLPVDAFKPIFGGLEPADGSLQMKCSKCGSLVYVAPSSWGIIHDNPGIEILCVPCLTVEMEKEKTVTIRGMNEAQADEIREYFASAAEPPLESFFEEEPS
jgi:hypothetical protein